MQVAQFCVLFRLKWLCTRSENDSHVVRPSRLMGTGLLNDISQVTLLSRIHHRNLVQFLGYCQEDGKSILIYEFMHSGTLKEHLYGN